VGGRSASVPVAGSATSQGAETVGVQRSQPTEAARSVIKSFCRPVRDVLDGRDLSTQDGRAGPFCGRGGCGGSLDRVGQTRPGAVPWDRVVELGDPFGGALDRGVDRGEVLAVDVLDLDDRVEALAAGVVTVDANWPDLQVSSSARNYGDGSATEGDCGPNVEPSVDHLWTTRGARS